MKNTQITMIWNKTKQTNIPQTRPKQIAPELKYASKLKPLETTNQTKSSNYTQKSLRNQH